MRTLSTMKKIHFVQGIVYTLMEKLGPVQCVLTQGDDDWEEYKLKDLVREVRCSQWKDRQTVQQNRQNKLTMERWWR